MEVVGVELGACLDDRPSQGRRVDRLGGEASGEFVERRDGIVEVAERECGEQGVLVREVLIERADRHAGRFRDMWFVVVAR